MPLNWESSVVEEGKRRYSLSDSVVQAQGLNVDGSPDMLYVKIMDIIEKLMFLF